MLRVAIDLLGYSAIAFGERLRCRSLVDEEESLILLAVGPTRRLHICPFDMDMVGRRVARCWGAFFFVFGYVIRRQELDGRWMTKDTRRRRLIQRTLTDEIR